MNERVVIELPVPMPTWNRILAMHPWQRKRLRDLIHQFVSLSITHGTDWPTSTVYQGKRRSTESLLLEYYATIRPKKSTKSATNKPKTKPKPQRSSSKR